MLRNSGDNVNKKTIHKSSTFVIGVTGGIGSGKTTVCNLFTELFNIPVIDADLISRDVVKKDTPALRALVTKFGNNILDSLGELDRPKMKNLIFSHPANRKILESIVHPEIRKEMRTQISQVKKSYCLLAVPLIAENKNRNMFDRILVVDCDEVTQMKRVVSRDQLANETVIAIMQAQATRTDRLAIADDIIKNNGPAAKLNDQVHLLHQMYQDMFREKNK